MEDIFYLRSQTPSWLTCCSCFFVLGHVFCLCFPMLCSNSPSHPKSRCSVHQYSMTWLLQLQTIVSKEKALPILWKDERWWWRMRMISCDFTVLLRRRYLNIACKPSCPTPQWKSSAPSSSTRPPFHFSQGGFLQFIQPIYHLLHHCQTCLQCCRSVQDNSGAPGQRPNKVADRENHLELLSPPAHAPGG